MGSTAKFLTPGGIWSTCVLPWTSTCHDDGPCQSSSPELPTWCCAATGNHQLQRRLAAADAAAAAALRCEASREAKTVASPLCCAGRR
eukprot:6213019-Pleurochrysis_carterae.AAC.3